MIDYPLANDPTLIGSDRDETEDLLRLTARSLAPKKEVGFLKPRPVVVKLDEKGATVPVESKRRNSKCDLLSGAVQDVLRETNPTYRSSRKGEEKMGNDEQKGCRMRPLQHQQSPTFCCSTEPS